MDHASFGVGYSWAEPLPIIVAPTRPSVATLLIGERPAGASAVIRGWWEGHMNEVRYRVDASEANPLAADVDGHTDGPDLSATQKGELVAPKDATGVAAANRRLLFDDADPANDIYQSARSDPTARDTDADGLWDGDEAFESVVGVGISKDGISMRGFRSDPSSFDSVSAGTKLDRFSPISD